MIEKRFTWIKKDVYAPQVVITDSLTEKDLTPTDCYELLNKLAEENEQLKQGMIGVVDRYIKNVDCNPPSSARTYMKIKGALVNIREDLRDLIGDYE